MTLRYFKYSRNLDTLEWEYVYPIFDTGRSLYTNVSKKYWHNDIVDMKFFSIPITYIQINAMDHVVDLFEQLLYEYQEELPLNMEDIKVLRQSFENRIKLFQTIMNNKQLIINESLS